MFIVNSSKLNSKIWFIDEDMHNYHRELIFSLLSSKEKKSDFCVDNNSNVLKISANLILDESDEPL